MLWDWDGRFECIHSTLYVQAREREGHNASPTTAIIDSRSAKAAQKTKTSIRRASKLARRSRAASASSSWRRIHTRYDRCAHTFFSAICIAAILIFWINQ